MDVGRDTTEDLPRWIPVEEVVHRLGISKPRLSQLTQKGRFRVERRRVGDRIRLFYLEEEVNRFIDDKAKSQSHFEAFVAQKGATASFYSDRSVSQDPSQQGNSEGEWPWQDQFKSHLKSHFESLFLTFFQPYLEQRDSEFRKSHAPLATLLQQIQHVIFKWEQWELWQAQTGRRMEELAQKWEQAQKENGEAFLQLSRQLSLFQNQLGLMQREMLSLGQILGLANAGMAWRPLSEFPEPSHKDPVPCKKKQRERIRSKPLFKPKT